MPDHAPLGLGLCRDSENQGMSLRFVPETTTSDDWTCWVLYAGDVTIASILTPSEYEEPQAREALRQKRQSDARILAQIDALIEGAGDDG